MLHIHVLMVSQFGGSGIYFDEVSMYNVIEFEFSKIRDTDRPVPLY